LIHPTGGECICNQENEYNLTWTHKTRNERFCHSKKVTNEVKLVLNYTPIEQVGRFITWDII